MANNTNVEWVPSLEELDDMMNDINNPSIDDCRPTFPSNNSALTNLNSVPPLFRGHGFFICQICEPGAVSFCTKSSLTRHLHTVHDGLQKKNKTSETTSVPSILMISAQDAFEALKTKDTFMIVNGRFSCPLCPNTYNMKKNAAQHLLAGHTTHKFTCTICQAKFTLKTSLQTHHHRVHGVWGIVID